jgi:type IV pilus assembly protein PilE
MQVQAITGPVGSRSRRAGGFTLIELMIVLLIMAILGTIATSAYRNYVLRANRTEARAMLLDIQVAQEKFFLQNNQYAQNLAALIAAPPAGLGMNLSASGATNSGNYTISLPVATANTFTVQAAAAGTQASGDTHCPTFTIDQAGVRTPQPDTYGCWR